MYGQLGHGDSEKQSVAKVVEALEEKVVYLLACGNFHTVSTTCIDGFHSIFSLGNWRKLHHHAAC